MHMINDILDLSLITNGKLRIQPATFSVKKVVDDVSKLISFQATNKGIDFITNNKFPRETEILMFNDENRRKQILLNLLRYAMKYSESV